MSPATVFHGNESCSAEAARRLVKKYDLVITSGGIGPTHDGM
jgi:molybdopterin-biosynthesis enzyme MoeA-like protein